MDTAAEMADALHSHHVDIDDLDACRLILIDAGFPAHLITVFLEDAIDGARFMRDEEAAADAAWEGGRA